jgi:hypothetical protein
MQHCIVKVLLMCQNCVGVVAGLTACGTRSSSNIHNDLIGAKHGVCIDLSQKKKKTRQTTTGF